MSTIDSVENLFQNPQFMMLLREQVQHLVGDVTNQRTETRQSSTMVEEIHSLVEKIIELNVKGEVESVTNEFHLSLLKVREEWEKSVQLVLDDLRQENSSFKRSIQDSMKEMKKEVIDDRLRLEQKICSINKSSTDQITNKIRDITNNMDENFPRSMKSLKMLPLSTRLLPDPDGLQGDEMKSKLKAFEGTIQEMESVLLDIQNRLHERYQVNIASLWTVVAELEDRILTEEKVQSKLDDLRGSILSQSMILNKSQQAHSQRGFKKWFNI